MDPAQARAAELRGLLRSMYVWPRRGGMLLVVLGAAGLFMEGDYNRPAVWAAWGLVAAGWAVSAWTMAKRAAFARDWLASHPLPGEPKR